jgi:hypothetical protein
MQALDAEPVCDCIEKFAVIWWRGETAISRARPPASPGDMPIITQLQLELLPAKTTQPAYGPFISRKEAKRQGLKRYYIGPCKHGHCVGRRVNDWKCPECLRPGQRIRMQRHYQRHAKRLQVKAKANRALHREWFRQWMNEYRKDPTQKLLNSLRSRLSSLTKDGRKSASTMDLTGCTVEELRQHLEAQFTDGMNWDNYGRTGWHIDHIRPCASFDLTDPEQQRQCFHYTNLQPLWAADNIRKGGKWQKPAE